MAKKLGGAGCRRKGHSFEREVAAAFRRAGFPQAMRHLEFQAQEAAHGIDVAHVEPYLVQCKRNRKYASLSKHSAIPNPLGIGVPVLVTKGDNLPALACIPFDYFLDLLEIVHGRKA